VDVSELEENAGDTEESIDTVGVDSMVAVENSGD
jgi:hypothetical protein